MAHCYKTIQTSVIYCFVFFLLCLSFFIYLYCNISFSNGCINFTSLFIWGSTFFTSLSSFFSFCRHGLKSYNIFFFIFSFFLHLNTYKLSKLQLETTINDLYYIVLPIYVYGGILFLFDRFSSKRKINNKQSQIGKFSVIIFIFLYVILSLYWVYRLQPSVLFFSDSEDHSIPGFSGVLAFLGTFLLFMTDFNKKKRKIIFFLFFIVYGVLSFHRGNIFRCLLFFIIYWGLESQRKYGKRFFVKIFFILFCSGLLFICLGNFRQKLRHGDNYDYSWYSSRYNVNISHLFWIYDYTIVNFDVIKIYYGFPADYKINYILTPFYRLIGENNSEKRMELLGNKYIYGLEGTNAATFIRDYIVDLKEFFLLELIIAALVMGFFLHYSKRNNYSVLYVYLCSLVALNFFTNNLFVPSIFFPVCFFVVLTAFFNNKQLKILMFKKGKG